ncbi:hypothetical protein JX265_003083 [Neoarthrinium moseri]|uniref:Uncharacterized protein n=1 Tax=Neoarthrinium moseri TaxID=1658444 RepID=A0A9Q0ASY3_9PEZI|nr:hypothetical protein JX265_003083 [Neoarthrinium moseri]
MRFLFYTAIVASCASVEAWRIATYEGMIGCMPQGESRVIVGNINDDRNGECHNFGTRMRNTMCYSYEWGAGDPYPHGPGACIDRPQDKPDYVFLPLGAEFQDNLGTGVQCYFFEDNDCPEGKHFQNIGCPNVWGKPGGKIKSFKCVRWFPSLDE